MLKRVKPPLFLVMSIFCILKCHAHDPDKAYFKILEEEDKVVVFAEFPWSIRKVLSNIKAESKADQNLNIKLQGYLRENIILENKNGYRFPIVDIQFLKDEKEDHHTSPNYRIIFEGQNLFKVTNTLMCDYFKDQKNYHTLNNSSDSKITNAKNNHFVISESDNKMHYILLILSLFSLMLFILIISKLKVQHK